MPLYLKVSNFLLVCEILFFIVKKHITHGLLAFLNGGDKMNHTSDCICTGSDNSQLILLTVGNSSSDQNVNSGEFNYQFKNLHTGNVM